jgi:hypothetical protein
MKEFRLPPRSCFTLPFRRTTSYDNTAISQHRQMAPYRPNANIVLYQRATKNISFDSSVILPYKSTPTPSDNELHTNGRNLIIFIDFILLSSHRKIPHQQRRPWSPVFTSAAAGAAKCNMIGPSKAVSSPSAAWSSQRVGIRNRNRTNWNRNQINQDIFFGTYV